MENSKKQTILCDNYDVIVVGGGIAGISSALASARNGAKTLLIESSYLLGGLATSGLVTIYLPLCDGNGHQLSYGIAEELLKLSVSLGAETELPQAWLSGGNTEAKIQHRYSVQYNPHVFGILAERELKKAGVDIFFGATLTDCQCSSGRLNSIDFCTRRENFRAEGRNFIDATGDATLCSFAGEKTARSQLGNALAGWYYEVIEGRYVLRLNGSSDYVYAEGFDNKGFTGLSGKELSDVTISSHELALSDFLKKGNVTKNHTLATLASIPQVRMTERLCGRTTLSLSDDKRHCNESVGMFGHWRKRGPAFELPFGTLIGNKIENLGVAGRCISVDSDEMWDVTRVIPVCAVSGQAIGTAAAISNTLGQTDVSTLQSRLCEQGVKLHLDELPGFRF